MKTFDNKNTNPGVNQGIKVDDQRRFYDHLNTYLETSKKVPIRRGCQNKQCFCTGACDEIIGYRDKYDEEKRSFINYGLQRGD